MSEDRTPIKVRGKRNFAQLRSAVRDTAPPDGPSRAKRLRLKLASVPSILEELPVELTEKIFIDSDNLDLPATSLMLTRKLSASHLRTIIIDRVLTILSSIDEVDESTRMHMGTLFDRRCLTWAAFQQWLHQNTPAKTPPVAYLHPSVTPDEHRIVHTMQRFMSKFAHVAFSIPLPKRVLTPPWTEDRLNFLTMWSHIYDCKYSSPDGDDSVSRALKLAVRDGNSKAVKQLAWLGDGLEENHLEAAIIDLGCNLDIIQIMLDRFEYAHRSSLDIRSLFHHPEFDGLNPRIWAWAESATQLENGKGKALKAKLTKYRASLKQIDIDAR